MIPKYVGFVVGPAYEGQHSDPTVCIGHTDGDCDKDDYTDSILNKTQVDSGEIPYYGDNPQVEIDVPDNQVEDVTEYGFGGWVRFQYRVPIYLPISVARNNWLSMAGISENGDWTQQQEAGDRALAVFYTPHNTVQKPTYTFTTYGLDPLVTSAS